MGGSGANLLTTNATVKLTIAPMAPNASGAIPKKTFAPPILSTKSVPLIKKIPLCAKT
jgi:hypothetical protein